MASFAAALLFILFIICQLIFYPLLHSLPRLLTFQLARWYF